MEVCLLWLLCVVRWRSLRWADHSTRGILPTLVCLSVCLIYKPQEWGSLGPSRIVGQKEKYIFLSCLQLLRWEFCTFIVVKGITINTLDEQVTMRTKLGIVYSNLIRCRKSVSGRPCDRPPRHRFFLVSLCLQANAEMVPKFPVCYYIPLM